MTRVDVLQLLSRVFKIAVYCSIPFVLLYFASFAWDVKQRRTCVQLPNGLMFGDEAEWSSQRPGARHIEVFKYPDGSVMIGDVTERLYISWTTVHGIRIYYKTDGKKKYQFAYRADTGLVIRKDDPDTYAKLVDEAGPMLPEITAAGKGWIDGRISYSSVRSILLKNPKFRRTDCPIAWFS